MAYVHSKAWRKKNPEKRNMERKRNYALSAKNNANRRQKYTTGVDTLILNSPLMDRELHYVIGRSVQAIQIRRTRLKSN